MLNQGRTGAEGVGLAERVLSLTQVRLLTVLAAATLMLLLFAATGDTSTAQAAGKPPAPQASATAPDNCGYSSFMPGYGFGSGFGYGFGYGSMGVPWWYQPSVCVPVVPIVSYSTCTPLPGVYNCSGYCGAGYWYHTSCPPACTVYSCAPYCVQAYSPFQYGFGYGLGYGTVPCQLAVDRVAFVDAPNSVNCGTSWDLVVQVWDALGHAVVDGTQVKFATSFGSVTASATTTGGKAVTRLVNAPGRSGLAQVTAQAGNVEGSAIIMVRC